MAFIGPWEIALIILVVLILFGPKKLPELAKSVGEAVRQYKRATEGVLEEPTKLLTPEKPAAAREKPAVSKELEEKERKALVEAAKKLGIETEGKTIEQISEEIIKKSEEKKPEEKK